MQKKIILIYSIIFFLLGLNSGYAQRFSPDYWHSGGVVLKSGDTLIGKLYYNLEENTVQIDDNLNKHFYHALKLEAIFFNSSLDSNLRVFHVYDYKLYNGYEVPLFFEILQQDSLVSLLGRERLIFLTRTGSANFSSGNVTMGFDFYLKFNNGKIVFLPTKKKTIIRSFPDEQKELLEFVKRNKMDFNSLEDVKQLISFYNQIKRT